jgi:hypothetical protein
MNFSEIGGLSTVKTYLAVDKEGNEFTYCIDEGRVTCPHLCKTKYNVVPLAPGTIKKLIGRTIREPYVYFETTYKEQL